MQEKYLSVLRSKSDKVAEILAIDFKKTSLNVKNV